MNKLDLRQVGNIIGLPIYVDFASVRDFKEDGEIMSSRDLKEYMVITMFKKAFNADIHPTPTKQEKKDE